jgi:uncharacterized protein (TIGR03437 family)
MKAGIYLLGFALAWSAGAQTFSSVFLDTVAGKAVFDNLPPRETPLIQPQSVWVHPNGEIYISDGNFFVRRVRGNQTAIIAGGGAVVDDSVPVPARNANLDFPSGIAGTASGDIYVSDVRHNRVRRISPDGSITTVAGRGTYGYTGDGGPAVFAELASPNALVLSANGNDLYIADTGNSVVRRYNLRTGRISTVAGTGEFGNAGDGGSALEAKLGTVRALALDAAGNLFLSDTEYYVVRRVSADGRISTVAGTGQQGFTGDDGPAAQARLGEVFGLAVDTAGNLYIADSTNHRIRRVSPDGVIRSIAGGGSGDRGREGPAAEVRLAFPAALSFDPNGNLLFAETKADLVRRLDLGSGRITTVAGTSNPFDGMAALEAPIVKPVSVAADEAGNLYVYDLGHFSIRKMDAATGRISTVAGSGREALRAEEGPATLVSLGGEEELDYGGTIYYVYPSIYYEGNNRLLIANPSLGVVRRLDLNTGRITTVANLLDQSVLQLVRNLPSPTAVVTDSAGVMYISDWANDQVLKWSNGVVSILAGTGRTGYGGDDGPATAALLNSPEGLLLDGRGGLLVCDSGNHMVRRIDLGSGIITRFAGDGLNGYDYDGERALLASMRNPRALARDAEANIYIADSTSHVVRVVSPNGIIDTYAGSTRGLTGDGGPAVLGKFDGPFSLAVAGRSIYVADVDNYRIRLLFRQTVSNALLAEPLRMSFRAVQDGELASEQLLVLRSSVNGLRNSWQLGGGTDNGGAWLYATLPFEGVTPAAISISVDHTGLAPGRYTGHLLLSSPGVADVRIPVDLEVAPPNRDNAVRLAPNLLQFTVPRGGRGVQSLALTAPGRTPLAWQVRRLNTASWLAFGAQSGDTPAGLEVRVDAGSLSPGSYVGLANVMAAGGGTSLLIVSLTVTEPRAVMQLDRSSMVFRATEGTTAAAPEAVSVLNTGSAPMNWEVVIPPGVEWLRASPSRGSAAPGESNARFELHASPGGLREGNYNATVEVRARDALDAPQSIGVRLRVLPRSAGPQALVRPAALVFVGAPETELRSQEIVIASTGGGELTYASSVRGAERVEWLNVTPQRGAIGASSERVAIAASVRTHGLTEGVYQRLISYAFSDGSVQEVTVTLIVTAGGDVAPGKSGRRRAGCSPARQVLAAPALANNFTIAAGWPVSLQAQVFDDCGAASAASTVAAEFSNGDPPQVLTNLRNGRYSATWSPANPAQNVTVTFKASHPALPQQTLRLSGRVSKEAAAPPLLLAGGVMNAASRRRGAVVAPGALLLLEGDNFPASADGISVVVGGLQAEVVSASPREIRALSPAGLDGQSRAALVIDAGGFLTPPEVVTVVPADPGLFAPDSPLRARPGEVIALRATGLGVLDGEGRPRNAVTARVGDTEASVQSISAAEKGVFEVRITVPEGVSGEQPVMLLQNGLVSNPVMIEVAP